MCRAPASSAVRTAVTVSSAGIWNTPNPNCGISAPSLSRTAGTTVGSKDMRVCLPEPAAAMRGGLYRRPGGGPHGGQAVPHPRHQRGVHVGGPFLRHPVAAVEEAFG